MYLKCYMLNLHLAEINLAKTNTCLFQPIDFPRKGQLKDYKIHKYMSKLRNKNTTEISKISLKLTINAKVIGRCFMNALVSL